MMKLIFILTVALTTPGLAQTPDPIFLQNALGAVQAQRNAALDQAAINAANFTKAQAALTQSQARVKELEDKYEPKPKPK